MKRYLDNIINGRTINANGFFKACEKKGISRTLVREVFTISAPTTNAKNQYIFTIGDDALYQATFARFYAQDEDRKVEASLHGSSKAAKSACGALVYRQHYQDKMGQSLFFEDNECLQLPSSSTTLIIVENANTFIKLSPSVVPTLDLEKVPIVWGRGADITGEQYVTFLRQYKQIVCFFDYDLGGLKIYASLYQKLGDRLSFYMQPKLDAALAQYGMPLTPNQYIAIQRTVVDETSGRVAEALLRHKKWLEQEVLQAKLLQG